MVRAMLLMALIAGCGGGKALPTGSAHSLSTAPMPDAPFDSDNVDDLGFQPNDIPGTRHTFEPDSPGERSDELWKEHLRDNGFQGRWWSDLHHPEAFFFSRISLWGGTREASQAMAYESERPDGLRGHPVGPLTPVPGLGQEGWCQVLERELLQPESTCRFRVANATIDVIVRTDASPPVPFPLGRLQALAMRVSERAEALARQ